MSSATVDVDMELSIKDRDRPGQKVTLECWIARMTRIVATSHLDDVDAALIEVRDDLHRQINDAKTKSEPRNNRRRRATIPNPVRDGGEPDGELAAAIGETFGSFTGFDDRHRMQSDRQAQDKWLLALLTSEALVMLTDDGLTVGDGTTTIDFIGSRPRRSRPTAHGKMAGKVDTILNHDAA